MSRRFFSIQLAALAWLGSLLTPLASLEASTLRVVAWNLEWFPGRSPEPTPEAAAAHIPPVQEAIKKLNPDILLSSEVQSWEAMQTAISQTPGLRLNVVSAYPSQDTGELWKQQLAIASKLPCLAAWAEPFRPTIPALPRGFAFAALQLPNDQGLALVYSVHLKSNRSRNQKEAELNFLHRDESAHQILEHINLMRRTLFRSHKIAGVIVGGDINTDHDGKFGDRVAEIFTKGGFQNTWDQTPREKRLTWRGNEQFEPTPFDYIFLQGFPRVQATMGGTPPEASDHDAIMVNIPLKR